MVITSTAGTVQLSPQVSECLSFDLHFLPFISQSVDRHRLGDFGPVLGPELESRQEAFILGARYYSLYEYGLSSSVLWGQQLVVVSPSARDTTFVSFIGELF
jgi:hypothetical protein